MLFKGAGRSRTLDARPDRADIRDMPYRAPLRSLPEQYPSEDLITRFLPFYSATDMVLDQGTEGACTGFGLAAVINYLKWEPWLRAIPPEERRQREADSASENQHAHALSECKALR